MDQYPHAQAPGSVPSSDRSSPWHAGSPRVSYEPWTIGPFAQHIRDHAIEAGHPSLTCIGVVHLEDAVLPRRQTFSRHLTLPHVPVLQPGMPAGWVMIAMTDSGPLANAVMMAGVAGQMANLVVKVGR